jgi:hypothetical protein
VLISIFLLILISMAIYTATTSTYQLRDKLLHRGDFFNGIRMAIGLLERDAQMLYSPVIMVPEDKTAQNANQDQQNQQNQQNFQNPNPQQQEMEALLAGELGRTSEYWLGAVDLTGIRPSRFNGGEQKVSFVAATHVRIYKDLPESEFLQVQYYLDDDKGPNAIQGAKVLIRAANPNAFSVEDRKNEAGKRIYPLLRGITKLKFEYWHKEKKEWLGAWDNDAQELKGQYPAQIRVTLEVKGAAQSFFEGSYVIRPEIPLNGLTATF